MAIANTPIESTPRIEASSARMVAPALVTLGLGLVLLFGVGFVQTPAVHNGAHDTRHANGFPCH
jgi:cobalt transporter subunit CbtB